MKILPLVFLLVIENYSICAQDYNSLKIIHDNANRIIEIQKTECSYTTYSYDKDGNRIQKLIKVVQPALEVSNTSCGLNNGTIEAFTPSGENYSYKWSTGSTQTKIINLAPATYQLIIKDLNNSNNYECSKEFEILASTNPILEAKITPQGSVSFCEGDTLKLKASYQLFNEYNWYRNGILVQNGIDSIYKATVGGTYWVEILNSGCSKVSPTVVLTSFLKPSPIVVPGRNPIICQNDTITLSSSISGISYKWNTNQTTKSIIVSLAGKYKLTLTDVNGCIGVSPEIEVKVNQLPQFTINSSKNPPVFCDRDSSLLTPSINGIKYQWNTNQSTKNIYVKSTGKYILTLTDNNQCSNSNSVDVLVNILPKVKANSSTNEICFGESITLFGSGANLYYWSNGVTNNNPFKPNNSQQYFLSGRDSNGCEDTSSIFVTVNALPNVTITSLNIRCYGVNDGEIHLSDEIGQPPFQYSIDNVNFDTFPDFINLHPKVYTVSIKDSKGCMSIPIQTEILQLVQELKTNISLSNPSCNGYNNGTIIINGSGGNPPFMYSLNGGGLSSKNNFIDLISANYTLRIVDKFGCIKDTSIFLSEPSTLNTFVELTTLDDCFPIGTGTLKVNSSGGTGNKTYSINNGLNFQPNSLFSNLIAANYNLITKDDKSCQDTIPISILKTPPSNGLLITLQNGKLLSPYSDTNRWFEIGNTNVLGIGKEYMCDHGSTYYVEGLDINGCKAMSAEFYTPCLSNQKDLPKISTLEIYPNPVESNLTIHLQGVPHGDYNIQIINTDGNFLKNSFHSVGEDDTFIKMDTRELIPGIYFIKVIGSQLQKNAFFIKI